MEKIRKLLVVICTYNPDDINYDQTFEDFSHVWFDVIRSWQMQRSNELIVDIVVSDNVSGPKTRKQLLQFQEKEKGFYIDFVDDVFLAPWIPFNHAVSVIKNKEEYDYFSYCASDAYFRNKGDLKVLLDDMDKNCCFISPYADKDMLQRYDFDVKKPPTKLRLNEAVNNHLAIMTREFMEAYDYKYIDIIGGGAGGNEELYTYQCSAIQRNELLSHKVCVRHIGMKDRKKIRAHETKPRSFLSPQYKRDFPSMLDEGVKVGLGFNELSENISVNVNQLYNNPHLGLYYLLVYVIINSIVLSTIFRTIFDPVKNLNILPKRTINFVDKLQGKPYIRRHNPDCFDENEYARNDDLYHFIKENLFLTKEELDYDKIRHEVHYPE